MSDKQYRMRVRSSDGKPKNANKVKGQNFPYADMHDVGKNIEFVIATKMPEQLENIRTKLASLGLGEIIDGSTDLPARPEVAPTSAGPGRQHQSTTPRNSAPSPSMNALANRPYGFVAPPEQLTGVAPIWHDGSDTARSLISGEVRFELTSLTPLLVGWFQRELGTLDPSALTPQLRSLQKECPKKTVLCPLRAPWGKKPILIPGDTLKGLLRHELGALLAAPMERVAERSYSYRPNLSYPNQSANRRLEPRLARVITQRTVRVGEVEYPMPDTIKIYPLVAKTDQTYYPNRDLTQPTPNAQPYQGGMGAEKELTFDPASSTKKPRIHTSLDVRAKLLPHTHTLPAELDDSYRRTLMHLFDTEHGHFSTRHPQVDTSGKKCAEAVHRAAKKAYSVGNLIWIEWDTTQRNERVVSFGWHYYYRWAYQDTIRRHGAKERTELSPLSAERGEIPTKLSRIRRIFGYSNDNPGCQGIGKNEHSQLMGHISINAAIEVVSEHENDTTRFSPPTFLKELGMPRPSAVEHYLQQPSYPNPRPSDQALLADQARLITYGDALNYDTPGKLAGRKFYLDRQQENPDHSLWADSSDANQRNLRSTLAVEASNPGRLFRFTLRFRDMEPGDVAAILLALCPNQFANQMGHPHAQGYCSKLGYARPLGWGSIAITAKQFLILCDETQAPDLREQDVMKWFSSHQSKIVSPVLKEWIEIHRRFHPDGADYPHEQGKIYLYHSQLRAEHAISRRYLRAGV